MNNRILKIRMVLFAMVVISGALMAASRQINWNWSVLAAQNELFRVSTLAWLATFLFINKRDDDWQNLEVG